MFILAKSEVSGQQPPEKQEEKDNTVYSNRDAMCGPVGYCSSSTCAPTYGKIKSEWNETKEMFFINMF